MNAHPKETAFIAFTEVMKVLGHKEKYDPDEVVKIKAALLDVLLSDEPSVAHTLYFEDSFALNSVDEIIGYLLAWIKQQ